MNDDLLERRLTRPAALRLAAVGAAGLALGARPAHAAPSDGAASSPRRARSSLRCPGASATRRRSRSTGAERTRWHWTVPSSVPRNGLPLGAMSADQRRLALALLRASSSAAGYRKALDIMALQGVLRRMNTGIDDPFDADRYYVSVFGTPGAGSGDGGSRGTTSPGTSRSWGTSSSPSRSSSVPGRPEREAHTARSRRATGRCRARRTRRGRSCSRSTARSGGASCSRRVADRPSHARTPSACGRSSVSACSRATCRRRAQRRVLEIVRTYLANHPPAMAREAFARVERAASVARGSAGPAARARASRTTTGCRVRRSCSSSTTRGTAAPTSTASGATSNGTSGDTALTESVGAAVRGGSKR